MTHLSSTLGSANLLYNISSCSSCYGLCTHASSKQQYWNYHTLMLLTGFLLVNLDFQRFVRFWENMNIYIKIEAQEQYSLIDTIVYYTFDFGPPGKYLYLSPKNPLSVGRRSRPRDSRFSQLFYRYFPGDPKSTT